MAGKGKEGAASETPGSPESVAATARTTATAQTAAGAIAFVRRRPEPARESDVSSPLRFLNFTEMILRLLASGVKVEYVLFYKAFLLRVFNELRF